MKYINITQNILLQHFLTLFGTFRYGRGHGRPSEWPKGPWGPEGPPSPLQELEGGAQSTLNFYYDIFLFIMTYFYCNRSLSGQTG